MARPERHDADYFPFYAKDGRTLFLLQSHFGLEGIGFFTNLLRFLTLTPDHHICIQDESDQLYLFAKIGIEVNRGLEMLELMAKTGKIDAELWQEKRIIVCEVLLESLTDAYRRRSNNPITIDEIRKREFGNNPPKEGVSSVINPTHEEIRNSNGKVEKHEFEYSGNNPPKEGVNVGVNGVSVYIPPAITHKVKESKLEKKNRNSFSGKPETAPSGQKKDRLIYHLLEDVFLKKNQEFNFKREAPHIKQLEEKCLARDPPEEFARALLVTFWKLTHSKEKLFKDKPFLPSILNSGGLYPYVLKAMENQELDDWDIVEVF